MTGPAENALAGGGDPLLWSEDWLLGGLSRSMSGGACRHGAAAPHELNRISAG